MNAIEKAWSIGWMPPDRRPMWEYARQHVTMPSTLTITGQFDPDVSRHFLPIFEALQNDLTRSVVLMKPVDSGGSLIGDIWAAWVPPNDPGAMLITFQSDDAVKKHAETRINPILDTCGPVAALYPSNKNQKRIQEIIFSNGMPLYMQGPALGNLQSQRIRYLRNEEIWMWPAGLRAEALGRIEGWEEIGMSKVYEPSQGGVENDDLDLAWLAGDQCEWYVPCLSCSKFCEASWGGKRPDGTRWGIVWNDDERTRDKEGQWLLPALLPTVRWECQHCGYPHFFDRCKREWNLRGRYEPQNPTAAPKRRSFHFDAIIIRSWEKQVEEFLKALKWYREGMEDPLRQIVQKQRARSWSDRFAPLDRRTETYDLSKPLEVDGETGMDVDCQQEGQFPCLVTTCDGTGKFFVREYSVLHSEAEISAKQAQWKIPGPWVFIDSGWGATTRDVYRMCSRHNWTACKGSDEQKFTHYWKRKDGRMVSVERSWKSFKGDPESGKRGQGRVFARGILWSNFAIKSRLKRLIDRGRWVEPQFNQEDRNWKAYQQEMAGEKLRRVRRKTDGKIIPRFEKVGPNHAWDCACEAVLRATIRKRLPDFEVEQADASQETPV